MEIAGYFAHFSIATYGAVIMNYFGFGTGILKDLLRLSPNKKAAIDHLKIPKEHMLSWEFGLAELYRPNFFVCWDERTNAIIVSIRGTLNMQECLVDAVCDYVPFQGGLVHRGFLRCALWLEENMLPKLKDWIQEYKAKALYLVGHSMGAGAASLFRMILSDHVLSTDPSFDIKTVCFATTATASLNLCRQYESCITTYINAQDLVPRVSFGSVKDFHELILTAADQLSNSSTTDEKLLKISERHQELLDSDVHLKLYAPGSIYYLYKTSRVGRHQGEPHYICEKSDALQFSDCRFGENAIFHHFLDKYDNSLRKVWFCYQTTLLIS